MIPVRLQTLPSAAVVLSPFWGAEGTICRGTQGEDLGFLGQESCDSFPLLTQGVPPSPRRSLSARRRLLRTSPGSYLRQQVLLTSLQLFIALCASAHQVRRQVPCLESFIS